MCLTKLQIHHLRNIEHISFEPSPLLNIIQGNNASGKSSILEAIFLLGRCRSFRTTHIRQIINLHQDHLIVTGTKMSSNGYSNQLGIQLDEHKSEFKINGKKIYSRSDMLYALPLLYISPKSFNLLESTPKFRREYLDWGIFNLHSAYLEEWRNYKRTLKQRNVILKKQSRELIKPWNHSLAQYGGLVNEYRRQYIEEIKPLFLKIAKLFNLINLEITYNSGWDSKISFLDVLETNQLNDTRFGYTQFGPHRADFNILIDGLNVKDYYSRGQIKLTFFALLLAQIELLDIKENKKTCILIDELATDLDQKNLGFILNRLISSQMQIFITMTPNQSLDFIENRKIFNWFHVEHGKLL